MAVGCLAGNTGEEVTRPGALESCSTSTMSTIDRSASTTAGSEAQRSSSRTSAVLGLRSERRRRGGRNGGLGTHSSRGHARGDLGIWS